MSEFRQNMCQNERIWINLWPTWSVCEEIFCDSVVLYCIVQCTKNCEVRQAPIISFVSGSRNYFELISVNLFRICAVFGSCN